MVLNNITHNILEQISGEVVTYMSVDTIINTDDSICHQAEFLNSLEISGIPLYKFQLKVGVPVLLMCNLDALRLCNGNTDIRILFSASLDSECKHNVTTRVNNCLEKPIIKQPLCI